MLAVPLVHVSPDHMAFCPREFGIDVEQRLHVVVTRRQLAKTPLRETEGLCVDHGYLTGC